MLNLAGNAKCDIFIEVELEEAFIPVVRIPIATRSEVPWSVYGQLGDWQFTRSWYYWVAICHKGSSDAIPFETAVKIQKDVGKIVRLDGDCGCRGPEVWLKNKENAYAYHVNCICGLLYLRNEIVLQSAENKLINGK